ncbi:hypothetical protein [Streptomyces sp. NRRL S-340]|uniref:hypothetical protein n=1 Tax=Streptomyces sp. NRRL S-340 TaxID=1463901 RepID=UPI00131B72B6|nr:hypothetical protein [Streptomyces sp. NRRL S-340]
MTATLMATAPARADEPGDFPSDPYQRTLRISLGEQQRKDRCDLSRDIRVAGPIQKAFVNDVLAGPDANIHETLHYGESGAYPSAEYLDAAWSDGEAESARGKEFRERQAQLDKTNAPYAYVNSQGGRPYDAPEFGADILAFTWEGREKIRAAVPEDLTPKPSPASLSKAKEAYSAIPASADDWISKYTERAADEIGVTAGSREIGSANDIASFLRFGGFPTKAPEPDSLEFRTEVETLKAAWAACDSGNPVDINRVLTGPVLQAHTEWEAEYSSQATQRKDIIAAEIAASKETQLAADYMIEAIRQSWQADQILFWQQYWRDHPTALNKPSLNDQKNATRLLATIRDTTSHLLPDVNAAVTRAKTAADQATAAQNDAWAIADQNHYPRGRGLMYAAQSVQVAKASAAAAQAAAKTVDTALKAIQANSSSSQAYYSLAQTQSHAVATEFRKAAALEAKEQAKAASEAAAKQAQEAAANAATAKQARTTAEKAEQDAKTSAAEAKRQREIAEAEKDNAERERDTAASERQKAQAAEERALSEKDNAQHARASAETAGSTAAEKLAAAEEAEWRAFAARDQAVKAEREKDATASRAAALEAAAAAAEGTEAASETRAAATEARNAANDAAGAAQRARAAANDATTAAVNSRAAATRAEGAAARSRSAADAAWSAYQKTHAAAATAHAAAAVAIDAAAAAQKNADQAEAEAKKAQAAAVNARKEATAAVAEAAKTAAWSAKTAGYAYATAQYAAGSRDAAIAVTKAADEAISLGSPYRETDSSAAFAVLIGQISKTLAEQQAAAAKAKSDEAGKAAAQAKTLADKAAGDAKIALQAAADAAAYAVQAQKSADAARASAAAASADAAAAKKADASAQKYDAQAGVDAVYAGFAADDAESAAAQADREATDAERDAASAQSAATSAQTDATAADSIATAAESDAVKAETAASNAEASAKDADAAATRAEAEERAQLAADNTARANAESVDVGGDMTADEEAILLAQCGQDCVDQFRNARALASMDVIDWVKENGAGILLEVVGVNDVRRCLGSGDVESCLWGVVDVASLVTVVGKLPAVGKAVARVAAGIGKFLEQSRTAKKTLEWLRAIIADYKASECLVAGVASASPAGAQAVVSSPVYRTTSGVGVRTAGFGQTLLAASAKKFCGIKWVSMVDQDWAVKGAHINLKNGREVRIFVDYNGNLAGQAIKVTAGLATQSEIDATIEAVKASSALRADFIAKATEAMNIMNTPLEKGGNWGMAQNRGAEMARLIRLLKKLG